MEAGHIPLSSNQWGSLADDRWGIGRWVCWPGQCMDCICPREVPCETVWERKCVVPSSSGALHTPLFMQNGAYCRRARRINRPRWLRMVCVDIRAVWRPGVSATVLVGGPHWFHGWLRRICQSRDGVVPGDRPPCGWFQVVLTSSRRCLNHRILCMAHWKIWRHLHSPSWYAA